MTSHVPAGTPAVRAPLRTVLFVPGVRVDRIGKALDSQADCVVVDLEDAVAASEKVAGRRGAVAGIAGYGRPAGARVAVRVNALDSGLLEDDLDALAPVWARLAYVVLPMVPGPDGVREMCRLMSNVDARSPAAAGPRLLLLIETAAGVLAAPGIAGAHPRVAALMLGPADLAQQLGISLSARGDELLFARSQLVLASAASSLAGPIDGPWLDLQDDEGLRESSAAARALGFAGKQVLHPRQLPAVTAAFSPAAADLEWAAQVVAAFDAAERRGAASIQLPDGSFVDYPVARRARSMLAEAAGGFGTGPGV